ncbi:methylated-DNA--[protein]-cysteine S-methyltransferase [Methylomonas sp. MgM2]
MAIQILWRSATDGERVSNETRFLGEFFVLTQVGGVIVDTAWRLPQDCFQCNGSASIEALVQGLTARDADPIQIRLLGRGSDFSRAVWQALIEIPIGQVRTYSDVARQLHSGPRAVAQACRNNPYPGIIPCHRVVSTTGIGGFGGQKQGAWVELKRRLLSYEREIIQRER